MKKRWMWLIGILLLVLALLLVVDLVWADVAPPEEPFGGDVAPGDTTMVQMVSEVVEITVSEDEFARGDFDFYRPVADVDASFVMQNQGDEDELLEVHFPLNMYLFNYADWPVPEVSDFEVWVDGQQVGWTKVMLEHPLDETSDAIAWAVFEVAFPVGQVVNLEVKYVMPAVGYSPRATFNYIFQTGGGWFDVIGEADLIVNLPYAPSDLTIAYPELLPEGGVIEGNQMRWHFEDLEPTAEDDFSITLMSPKMVKEIQEAEAAVLADASFDNLDALTDVFYQVMSYKGMFVDESWGGFVPAYEEALMMMNELEPGNSEVKAKFAVALIFHEELQGYDRLTDVPLPVEMGFVEDVMFEMKQMSEDDFSVDEAMVFWILDLYFYSHLGDDYETYFLNYVPQGFEMPAADADALEMVTSVLP